MLEIFGDLIELEKYYGPVQMGVWELQYCYFPEKYKAIVENEIKFFPSEEIIKINKRKYVKNSVKIVKI